MNLHCCHATDFGNYYDLIFGIPRDTVLYFSNRQFSLSDAYCYVDRYRQTRNFSILKKRGQEQTYSNDI